MYWSSELITKAAQLDGQVIFPRLAKGAVVFGSGICWFSSVGRSLGSEVGFGGAGEESAAGRKRGVSKML